MIGDTIAPDGPPIAASNFDKVESGVAYDREYGVVQVPAWNEVRRVVDPAGSRGAQTTGWSSPGASVASSVRDMDGQGCRACVVYDESLTAYDFGPTHPMTPVRLDLTISLAEIAADSSRSGGCLPPTPTTTC